MTVYRKNKQNEQAPKNDPDLEKAAALLMAALAWSESPKGQAAMLKADCNQPKQRKAN